jgi:hypothetical protein
MTEGELLGLVMAECVRAGLLVHHCGDARRCKGSRGFPDLMIFNPRSGAMLWAELKSSGGGMGPGQTQWKWSLLAGGHAWRLWRPPDWDDGTVTKELEALG